VEHPVFQANLNGEEEPSFDLMHCGSEHLDNVMVEYSDGGVITMRIIAITEYPEEVVAQNDGGHGR